MDIVRILKISGVIAGLFFTLVGCKEEVAETASAGDQAPVQDMGFLIATDGSCSSRTAALQADLTSARVWPQDVCFVAGRDSNCVAVGNQNTNFYTFRAALGQLLQTHAAAFPTGNYDAIVVPGMR